MEPQKPLKLDFIKNPNVRKYDSYCMITICLFSDDPAPTGRGKDGGGGDAEFCRCGHGAWNEGRAGLQYGLNGQVLGVGENTLQYLKAPTVIRRLGLHVGVPNCPSLRRFASRYLIQLLPRLKYPVRKWILSSQAMIFLKKIPSQASQKLKNADSDS